jgi:hypothetical protein
MRFLSAGSGIVIGRRARAYNLQGNIKYTEPTFWHNFTI